MLTKQESELGTQYEQQAIHDGLNFSWTQVSKLISIIRKLECQNTRWRHAWAAHDQLEAEEKEQP